MTTPITNTTAITPERTMLERCPCPAESNAPGSAGAIKGIRFAHHSAEPRMPRIIPNACHTVIPTAMIAPTLPISTMTVANRFIVSPNV